MRTIQALRKTRPRSCGRVSSQAYFEWKCYHNQLWRFPQYQVKPEDAVDKSRPMEVIRAESDIQHQEDIRRIGPRKGDDVYRMNGDYLGKVAWMDRKAEEVCIFNNGRYVETVPLNHFTNKSSPRGRTRWLLV